MTRGAMSQAEANRPRSRAKPRIAFPLSRFAIQRFCIGLASLALTERWIVRFTNNTSFEVIGENVGVIATGNTSADCAPNNPATGVPYFRLPALGWGNGWATGNVLRFNTIGAQFPVWVVRTVQQGPESVPDDNFTLLIRGDVNA